MSAKSLLPLAMTMSQRSTLGLSGQGSLGPAFDYCAICSHAFNLVRLCSTLVAETVSQRFAK